MKILLKWLTVLAEPTGLTIGQKPLKTIKPVLTQQHNKTKNNKSFFFTFLKSIEYRWQVCQNLFTQICRKWLKTLCYACQASSWQRHFACAHMHFYYIHIIHLCITSLFFQVCIFIVYKEMINVPLSMSCCVVCTQQQLNCTLDNCVVWKKQQLWKSCSVFPA